MLTSSKSWDTIRLAETPAGWQFSRMPSAILCSILGSLRSRSRFSRANILSLICSLGHQIHVTRINCFDIAKRPKYGVN
jgi:hypothetical protein